MLSGLRGEDSIAELCRREGCSAAIVMRPATVRMGIRHRGNGMIVAA